MAPLNRILRHMNVLQHINLPAFTLPNLDPKPDQQPYPRNDLSLGFLLMAACPLFLKAFVNPSIANIFGYVVGAICLGLGLWCISKGLKAEGKYRSKTVAKPPKFKFKLIGSGLVAVACAGLTLFADGGFAQAFAVYLATFILSIMAFGIDPLNHKTLKDNDTSDLSAADDIATYVSRQMDRVRGASAALSDPEITPCVSAFGEAVDSLIQAAQGDPERTNNLRKYFGVYLEGAAEASERLAAAYSGTGSLKAKTKYLSVIEKLTRAYATKAAAYAAA